MTGVAASLCVRIRNGSFYVAADVYEAYFRGRDSVGVLMRDDHIVLCPLFPGSVGGSLAKIHNARGDRVIHARELLRELELDDSQTHELAARWDAELAALTIPRPTPRAL